MGSFKIVPDIETGIYLGESSKNRFHSSKYSKQFLKTIFFKSKAYPLRE